jgi:KilA-N domain
MSKAKRVSIDVQGTAITILTQNSQDFISLTDMAKKFGDVVLIYSWMRNRNTLEFIGIWEKIHNPDFKGLEFETFKSQAGLNSFSLTPRKWIEATGAIGFESRAGRYGGGTYLCNYMPCVQTELTTLGVNPHRAIEQIVTCKHDPGNFTTTTTPISPKP